MPLYGFSKFSKPFLHYGVTAIRIPHVTLFAVCLTPAYRMASAMAHTYRFISANLPCNKFKNRLVNIMPYGTTRVCLQPIRGVEGSDYINASFIDGYR